VTVYGWGSLGRARNVDLPTHIRAIELRFSRTLESAFAKNLSFSLSVDQRIWGIGSPDLVVSRLAPAGTGLR
jgi:hypothetical protein